MSADNTRAGMASDAREGVALGAGPRRFGVPADRGRRSMEGRRMAGDRGRIAMAADARDGIGLGAGLAALACGRPECRLDMGRTPA